MTPIFSMTGFGTSSISLPQTQLSIQLKSVNSRYLDLSFKMPDELNIYEGLLRDTINQRVKRGKLECKFIMQSNTTNLQKVDINITTLQNILAQQQFILQHAPLAQPLSVSALMQHINTSINHSNVNHALAEVTQTEIEQLIHAALDDFLSSRAAEGSHLAHTLTERLNLISQIVNHLRGQLPELLAHQETKLTERLFKAIDSNKSDISIAISAIPREELLERIRQEASLTAIRVDVAEELDRLEGHINNTRSILSQGAAGGIGKRLDFLMQEFNREANTLGSKSASLLQTEASMSLKLIIEQMREQVQNIE